MHKITLIATLSIVLLIAGCMGNNTEKSNNEAVNPEPVQQSLQGNPKENMWIATKNTTRVNSDDPSTTSAIVSRTIWPDVSGANRPSAIILTDPADWRIALVSVDLIHFPTNGPVLFSSKDRLSDEIKEELKRLNPSGIEADNGTQVILAGKFENSLDQDVQQLGFKTKKIEADTPEQFALEIDKYYAKLQGSYPSPVIVGSMESPEYTIPAANWIAHMPEPLLYTNKDIVPEATVQALQERSKEKLNIYLLGPTSVIAESVEKQLRQYGKVNRISGENPIDNAIAFAMYQDPSSGFGWGIQSSGHNLSFIPEGYPELAIAAAPFSHLGKHAPMLWISKAQLDSSTKAYLSAIQPKYKMSPSEGPFNHAWITGNEKLIPFDIQTAIDESLEIVSESGMDHGNMDMGDDRGTDNQMDHGNMNMNAD